MSLSRLLILLFFWCTFAKAQDNSSLYKTIEWSQETPVFYLPKTPLNNSFFEIKDATNSLLSPSAYTVDYNENSIVLVSTSIVFPLKIKYLELPSFLSTPISYYNTNRIVPNEAGELRFKHQDKKDTQFIPFEGLNVVGSLSRGITVGNNQNSVTSSNLDLQITGKLSESIGIRASIQDNNLPLQYGGYSQKINEFDQLFIELFTDDWSIRAGDIALENRKRRFLNFSKQVQGLSSKFNFENTQSKTTVEVAAALVKGQYTRSTFKGQEGNQGPYKLKGNNGELYILIVSGSEKIYINGLLLTRGENNDYIIDYNSGEVLFTTKFPITSEMRIEIDYQYTDRNYTRFVGYGDIQHQRKNWSAGISVLAETDLKNQPLQQSLSKEQIDILKEAGNNTEKMIAPSAYRDSYSENKILYQKLISTTGIEYFEFSTNPDAELYQVAFSFVGANKGEYILKSDQAIGKVYEYIAPINGISQGSYSPIIRLVAPIKTTIASFNAQFNPSEKTNIEAEVAISNYDANLFSPLDNQQNKGWATTLKGKQRLWTGEKSQFNFFTDIQFIHKDFHSLENLFSSEYYRNWNVYQTKANQSIIAGGLEWTIPSSITLSYHFEQLNYGNNYDGHKHRLNVDWKDENWNIQSQNSVMQSTSIRQNTTFIQNNLQAKYSWKNNYTGTKIYFEQNKEEDKSTSLLSPLSHRYTTSDFFIGKNFDKQRYVEIGYQLGINDSLQNNTLKDFSRSNTFYIKTQLVKTDVSELNMQVNYRTMHYRENNLKTEQTVNSIITYNDQFFKGLLQTNTYYEISSGSIAQQEYTYLEVEAGLGQYMWIDYNQNGIQELEEFEIATSPDVAKYVRLYLPNQVFLPIYQNKMTQTLGINPAALWKNSTGIQRFIAHFYSQTSYAIDRKDLKSGNTFSIDPLRSISKETVGLSKNINTYLYYNRGIKKHSVTYGFLNTTNKNLLSFGTTETSIKAHSLSYNHLIQKTWLFDLSTQKSKQTLYSSSYSSKNYELKIQEIEPKISYLFSDQTNLNIFYNYKYKNNTTGDLESMHQHQFGIAALMSNPKIITFNGEISFFSNKFEGNSYSPVAYQMLEGLQPGKNITWRIMLQKNITNYLDINLNYQGRSNESTPTIHTGNIQLRAFF